MSKLKSGVSRTDEAEATPTGGGTVVCASAQVSVVLDLFDPQDRILYARKKLRLRSDAAANASWAGLSKYPEESMALRAMAIAAGVPEDILPPQPQPKPTKAQHEAIDTRLRARGIFRDRAQIERGIEDPYAPHSALIREIATEIGMVLSPLPPRKPTLPRLVEPADEGTNSGPLRIHGWAPPPPPPAADSEIVRSCIARGAHYRSGARFVNAAGTRIVCYECGGDEQDAPRSGR